MTDPQTIQASALRRSRSRTVAKRILSVLRLGIGGAHGRARAILAIANAAQAASRWSDAAAAYRAYLNEKPNAFAIWVQLGHALKEDGRMAEAATAYDRAMALDDRNADLLVNYGHFHKINGRPAEAAAAYRKSFAIDGNADAAGELRALGEAPDAAAPSIGLPAPMSLFVGSDFAHLSTGDPLEILRRVAAAGQPAENLARVDPDRYSPLISLVVPVYNTPVQFLYDVVQSVTAQSYRRWELLLVDDGSTDPRCKAALEEIRTGFGDRRIIIHAMDANSGISAASHEALMLATGEYVGFLDHDDILAPHALSLVVASLRADAAIDYVYTDHCMVTEEGIPLYYARKPGWSPEFLLATNYLVHFKVVRRALLLEIGGLCDEIPGVQDLGMSLRLAASGARIHHIPEICYMWRSHQGSVASSSEAKPGIETSLIETYDRYLVAKGSSARQVWPDEMQADRIGVFRPRFADSRARTAVVVLLRSGSGIVDRNAISTALLPVRPDNSSVHFVQITAAPDREGVVAIADDAAFLRFVQDLDCDYIAIVNATARAVGIDWLRELTGYLDLDPLIGAVGGKTLDEYLRVKSAGLLFDDGELRTLCGGSFDNAPGHWFVGRIASNVDAVSSGLMISRKSAIVGGGGIPVVSFGDAAGTVFSLRLRETGHRVVYNPFAKVVDVGQPDLPSDAMARVAGIVRDVVAPPVYRKVARG